MFSSGVGSWAAARRVVDRHGPAELVLLFSDVKGDSTDPHVGEDEDNYRFLYEAHADVGGELVITKDGRDIWQTFKDDAFLGNTRLANCSKFLKQKPARAWLEANCDPATTTLYVGIDWSEIERIPANRRGWAPWWVEYPMTVQPYLDKDDVVALCRSQGMEPPRLYGMGFAHANCGGGCVRAGQGQFARLLKVMPERYLAWETHEEDLRQHLGKDVAILRDRRGGKTVPLTLRAFRERHEAEPEQTDMFDLGGCGCFVDNGVAT